MKQYVIIGLDTFGRRVLDELLAYGEDVLIIDKNEAVVNQYKDVVASALIVDVVDAPVVKRVAPVSVDAVIVDLGSNWEAAILVTNHLKKHGIRKIIARADSDEQAEILRLVGAHQVVLPHQEAARRVVPTLVTPSLLSFFPVGADLVIAEVGVPPVVERKTVIEADLRRVFGVTLIAVRKPGGTDYLAVGPEYRFEPADIFLISGSIEKIDVLTSHAERGNSATRKKRASSDKRFSRLFGRGS